MRVLVTHTWRALVLAAFLWALVAVLVTAGPPWSLALALAAVAAGAAWAGAVLERNR